MGVIASSKHLYVLLVVNQGISIATAYTVSYVNMKWVNRPSSSAFKSVLDLDDKHVQLDKHNAISVDFSHFRRLIIDSVSPVYGNESH